MGFKDPDLKLQSHDDIIFWIYKDEIIKEIIKKYILKGTIHFELRRCIYLERELKDSYNSLIYEVSKDERSDSLWVFSDENYSSLLKNWKERIKRYRKDEDLINAKEDINKIRKKRRDFKIELIKITNEYQKYVEKYETHLYILKKIPEYTIKNSKGYEIGFIDLKIEIKVITNKDTPGEYIFPCNLYFEAKTQYSTFSVLMRQLNMYKNNIRTIKSKVRNVYDTENYLFLVGPQNLKINNFEEILKDQEWQFIEIPFKIKNKKKENLQTKLF